MGFGIPAGSRWPCVFACPPGIAWIFGYVGFRIGVRDWDSGLPVGVWDWIFVGYVSAGDGIVLFLLHNHMF